MSRLVEYSDSDSDLSLESEQESCRKKRKLCEKSYLVPNSKRREQDDSTENIAGQIIYVDSDSNSDSDNGRFWRPRSLEYTDSQFVENVQLAVDEDNPGRHVTIEPTQPKVVEMGVTIEEKIDPQSSGEIDVGIGLEATGISASSLNDKESTVTFAAKVTKEEVPYESLQEQGESIYPKSRGNSNSEQEFYICPRSGYKERTWITSNRDQHCPVRKCPVVTRSVRRHVLQEHLSSMFDLRHDVTLMTDPTFHQYRGYMIMVLAKWLTRSDDATSTDLVDFLRRNSRVPRGYQQFGEDMPVFRTVCREMNWSTRAWFRIEPSSRINSPCCILHWRVMASLLHFLTPTQQDLVHSEVYDPQRNHMDKKELYAINSRFYRNPVVNERTPAVSERDQRTPAGSKRDQRTPAGSERDQRTAAGSERDQRTPAGYERDKRIPAWSERDQRTPAGYERDQRTPAGSERDQRTPAGYERHQRSPAGSERDQRTPAGSERDKRTPAGSERDQRTPARYERHQRIRAGSVRDQRTAAWSEWDKRTPVRYERDQRIPARSEQRDEFSCETNSRVMDLHQPRRRSSSRVIDHEDTVMNYQSPPSARHIVVLHHGADCLMMPCQSLEELQHLAEDRFPGNGVSTLYFQGAIIDNLMSLGDIIAIEARPVIDVRFLQ
ncbi:Hypothetical predicted protein [Mytilus galloprovincialis]|uniref:Uncharacterized protein n=1 Tax=Mytilus galloprovincialis TaxID=29158 RepID=A0A8B6EHM0_MYTGA|nr:Hypothetical predicted protein [Mytilus galloprovincialis]